MYAQKYDVLIIGSGIAGITAAIKLAEQNLKIAIVSKEKKLSGSNTFWAQGGIIYPENHNELLRKDIQNASADTSNDKAIDVLLENASKVFDEILLDKANVPFNLRKDGHLALTKEASHSEERIAYHKDCTGKAIEESINIKLNEFKNNITFLKNYTAIDLITPSHHGVNLKQRYEDEKVVGAYLFDQENKSVVKVISKITILATGGIGAIYLHHTNAEGARGDGIAMASRAGAKITNMEFIQFHPTAFYDQNSHRRFLVSEAVRGEGAILKNKAGEEFMVKYHPDRELAPRDIVARSIVNELFDSGENCVYLDISHKDSKWIIDRFPTIHAHCLEHGFDMTKEGIPVVPAAHYLCGGIKCDEKGQTNLKNLYAIGEVSCTGLHGANRLASTSLLEGLTWGFLAAENIIKNISKVDFYDLDKILNWTLAKEDCDLALVAQDWLTVRQTMWNYVGVFRSYSRLKRAGALLNELSDEIHKFYKNAKLDDELIGLRNGVEVSQLILKSSIQNTKSEGCFYRYS